MASDRREAKFKPNAMRTGVRFDRDAASRPILVFEDVYKAYRSDQPVLRGMNLTIERGEFVFITGPSGAGKSTLLRLLYRAEMVDQGRILFLGRDVARLTSDSIPMLRRNIGVVFQDFKLVPHWTVFDNVAVTLEVLGLPTKLVRSRVGEALERVGLGGRGQDKARVLSGGEQQRVSVARAIVGEPAILLADEPTGNLDPLLAIDILGLFEDIHASGTTVLFATHDRTLLEIRPRRVVVLDEGKAMDVRAGFAAPEPGGFSEAPAAVESPVSQVSYVVSQRAAAPLAKGRAAEDRARGGEEEPIDAGGFDDLDDYGEGHVGAAELGRGASVES